MIKYREMYHRDPAICEVHKALKLAVSSGAAPEVISTLESALEAVRLRDDFILESTSGHSGTLKGILEETFRRDWLKVYDEGKSLKELGPNMMSSPLEGQFLKSIVSIQKAKRVLDIGMFTGYSALAMAEALPADGELVTVDVNDYLKPLVTDLIKSSPHKKKIKIVIGKAVNVLKDMAARGEKFDLVFLDAAKSEYPDYFKLVFEGRLLNPGGTILVDDAFMRGDGYIPSRGNTPTKQFAHMVASDKSLHKVLVPLRDGMLMIRRLSDVEGSVE